MKRSTRVPAALLVAVVSLAPAPALAAHLRNVSERVFPFASGGDVTIASTNGRIVVEAWDRSEVRVQITREVRAGSDDQAQKLMRELKADVAVHPSEIRIVSVYPQQKKMKDLWDWIGRGVRSTNIHYYLQVPRATSLDLSTSNGEVRIRSVEGHVEASTTNGDVDVTSLRGSLEARTTNGQVRLTGIDGPADAATTNGSVSAQLTSLPARGTMKLETTNGNVRLTLPRQIRATLQAQTTNGRVSVGYPMTTQGTISSRNIRGTIGGGGVRIELQTTNGNIAVGPPVRSRSS